MLARLGTHLLHTIRATGLTAAFLVVALIGCSKPAPMTNTIVSRSANPEGQAAAILVERYRHAALNGNIFYVLVISNKEEFGKVVNEEEIGKRSALIATRASKVTLHYEDPSTLLVKCAACGLEAVDIMQKLDHVGDTRIVFQGFPQHTAYE